MLNYQIASLIKGSILNATNRVAVRSVEAACGGSAAIEGEGARKGGVNRTAPIVAACALIKHCTIVVVAEAIHG